MEITEKSKTVFSAQQDDLRSEYRFDYSKSKSNRFIGQQEESRTVVLLDPKVSEVFQTSESVNAILRSLIDTMPSTRNRTYMST